MIREGTQEERDHYGELFVRFLFAGPARTGMLHADPHPGNFRILPNDDGTPGRLGVLDFGAVARLDGGGLPEAMGRLIRVAGQADRDGLEAGLRAEGFIKDKTRIDPDLLLDYLAPFVEPTQVDSFQFTREWMREQFQRINNPKEPTYTVALKLNLPPSYMLIHRTWLGGIGVLSQLGASRAVQRDPDRVPPGLRGLMGALRTGRRVAQELGRVGMDRGRRRGGLPPQAAGSDRRRPVPRARPRGHRRACARRHHRHDRPDPAGDRGTRAARVGVRQDRGRRPGTRIFGGLARLGEVEVGFYREVRPSLDLEAPDLIGASFDRRTGRFVIVLEDLSAKQAAFCDTLTRLTTDQTAQVLSQLARLHGATSQRMPTAPWLGTNSGDAFLPLIATGLPRLAGKVAERLPELAATPDGDRLLRSYRRWAADLDTGPQCVLHGDPHPGNVYLLPSDPGRGAGLLDWQAVRRGHPLRDVTYHLVLGMTVSDRRTHERDLLAHYVAELATYGGPLIAADEAWRQHCRMAGYAYVAAMFTSGLGGLQNSDIADAGLKRSTAAIADLGTAALLAPT